MINNQDDSTMQLYPKVSVITASYNSAKALAYTIEQMRNVTYPDLEFIVIDGGSSDETAELLRKSQDIVTKWISEKDKGIYDAWNKGLALATGEWIAFVGAGDYYLPNGIQSYIDYIKAQPRRLDFCSSQIEIFSEDGGPSRVVGAPWNWDTFRRYMNVAHVGALHRRQLFQEYGKFSSDLKVVGDYEFLCRPGPDLQAGYFKSITARMVMGGVSNGFYGQEELMKVKVKMGLRTPLESKWDYWIAITKLKIRNLISTGPKF
ncbi:MAG: glycosyltransferase family 2 protein [Bdellovibrionales bacterium]